MGREKRNSMDQELWFFEENLIMPLQADTKEEALTKLGTLLLHNGYVKESFIPAILAREVEYATGLPTGEISVAIPHTDAIHVSRQAVAVGILENPVQFCIMGDPDNTPVNVNIIFMLAVPDKDKVMVMLQQLMDIIPDKNYLSALGSTKDRAKIVEMLNEKLNAGVRAERNAKPEEETKPTVNEITLTITHPVGLHARPATLFVRTAAQFKSAITIKHGEMKGNAKSIIKVLCMGAVNGSTIQLSAEGEDAQEALAALKELVESDFGGVE
ncbi:MAG TPA: hypothetical protein DD636_01275 [Anaerolineaceae bacterium]|jgi:PTS system galactitol-specific IIA component|nr:hypothetical protein [Anaerolineaceae bacterium]